MYRSICRATRCLVRNKINVQHLRILQRFPPVLCIANDSRKVDNFAERSVSSSSVTNDEISPLTFEKICNETLESLCEYFEELVENNGVNLKNADVMYGDGVLTVNFGNDYGTYVINRQTPNKQIWLSSPTSGPKRYDLDMKNGGCWIYKHDGISLHQLLQKEIPTIVKQTVDFSKCAFSLI